MVLPLAVPLGVAAASMYLDAKYHIVDDLGKAAGLARVSRKLKSNDKADRNSIYYLFDDNVKARKNAECYACEDVSLSWVEVAQHANRLAHFLLSRGVKRGDVIALYLPNKPAYPIIWLACLSINVVPAFINFNLTDDGLRHCIAVSGASVVLYESDLAQSIAEVASVLRQGSPNIAFMKWSDSFSKTGEKSSGIEGEQTIDPTVLAGQSAERIPDSMRKGIGWQDPCCLIYTSGTTGLPKAAIVTHGRSATAFIMWSSLNHFDKNSRIFTPMPLYHSTAALLAVGVSWYCGATVIIGRKFSASTFWKDVREHDANVIQYVGEVLRYLLAVPPSPDDKNHSVKQAYGNGCRPDVWNVFRERFGVQTISEFFASSEGNGSLFNHNRNNLGAGAVGHEGLLAGLARRKDQCLVKVDSETEAPARDENGWCIRADPDEPAEMICRIVSDSPHQNFAGYHGNTEGTNKKILRDVFVKGDAYFRTGDLLRRTKEGYWYFADRLGDTFRWKSENVGTQAVQEAINAVVPDLTVYGVLVPGHEGRAGCAAIPKSAGPVNLEQLATHVSKVLPKYAQPLFVRFVDKLPRTGTEKIQKALLQKEGVDPMAVKSDSVYWLQRGKYTPFTLQDWERLQDGKVKL